MTHKHPGSEYFNTHSLIPGIRKRAIQSGGTMLFSRSANTAIQMVSTVILARMLTPEDFGLVTMVTAFSFLLANVGFNGFTEAIIQKEDVTHEQVSTIFWIGIGISVGLAILFSVSSPLIARFYHEPRLIPITIVISISFIFSALATEHLALIMRNMQFHKIMINELISAVISVVLAIFMAWKGYGYWAIIARQVSIPILGAVIAWLQCPWRPGLPVKKSGIGPMMKYAINTFGNFTVNYLGLNLDKVLLGKRWGSQELGTYDRAYRLFMMPVNQMTIPLTGVALATLSRLKNDPEKYRRYYLKSLSMLSLIGMLASVIMTVAGRDIIYFLLGPQWTKSGLIFSALGPSIGITLIYATHGWLHLSQGNANRWFKWGIWAFAFTALALIIGLQYGALGVAIAYGLSFYLLTPPGLWYAGKPMGIRLSHVWQASWRCFLASLLTGFTAWWAFNHLQPVLQIMIKLGVVARIAVTSVVCAILYLGLVIAFHKSLKPVSDIIRMMKMTIPGLRDKISPQEEVS